MKAFCLRWYAALLEALVCFSLGIRSAFRNGLWWRSACLCTGVVLVWVWIYYYFAKQILIIVGLISIVAAYGALAFGPLSAGGASVSGYGAIGGGIVQLVLYAAAVAAAIYVIFFAFMVLTTIRLPLKRLFMDRSVDAVARSYANLLMPECPEAPRAISRGKVVFRYCLLVAGLFIPVLAGGLLLLMALYLNVRLLYRSAVKRVYGGIPGRLPLYDHFPRLLMLGLLAFVCVFIPVLNLLLPAVMCTSILHLIRRGPNATNAMVYDVQAVTTR